MTKKLTIEEMNEIARSRGGKCLSTIYVNSGTDLLWECINQHQWLATPDNVKGKKSWCKECGFKSSAKKRLTPVDVHGLAKERGGFCLSEQYQGSHIKLQWQCSNNHTWEASPRKIKNGQWCPECSSFLGERICREFFEQIFKNKFPKSHPNWLKNSSGNQMELDGYCEDLKIAFEHHGQYHYRIEKHYTKNQEKLKARQKEDRLKKKLCKDNLITLIIIPEVFTMTKLDKLPSLVKQQCKLNGIIFPKNDTTINLNKAYIYDYAQETLVELKKLATLKGGECLADHYISSSTKLPFKCLQGHTFTATPNTIKRGTWCLKCGGRQRLTLKEMQSIAKHHGGKCLSKKYKNAHQLLIWQCSKQHIWRANANSVKNRGTWCRLCALKKRRLPNGQFS